MSKRRAEISDAEWLESEWVEVTGFSEVERTFVRGRSRSFGPAWITGVSGMVLYGSPTMPWVAPADPPAPEMTPMEKLDVLRLKRWEEELAKQAPPEPDGWEDWA